MLSVSLYGSRKMSSSNTAADGLIRFWGTAGTSDAGAASERIGRELARAGDEGLTFEQAWRSSGIARSSFFSAVMKGVESGFFERFDVKGEERLRLAAGARSLF